MISVTKLSVTSLRIKLNASVSLPLTCTVIVIPNVILNSVVSGVTVPTVDDGCNDGCIEGDVGSFDGKKVGLFDFVTVGFDG